MFQSFDSGIMIGRGAGVLFSQTFAFFASMESKICSFPIDLELLRRHPFRISLPCLLRSSSSCCSPPDDGLTGLIDPEFVDPIEGGPSLKDNCREDTVPMKDPAFLHEDIADYDATSSRSSESKKFSEEAVSICDGIRAGGVEFGDKTHRFLRQFRGKLNVYLVAEVLELLADVELGVKFFIWAGRQIGFHHSGPTYDVLLDLMGVDKKSKIPHHFLREIGEDDREVLGNLLNVMIRKCCRSGYWNEALEELGRLKDFGYRPSRTTYNALIQVLLKADRLDSAFLVHREMSDSGFFMDSFTIGCFAHSLCKAGRWVEVLNIIETEDFTPDTVIYNKMISGLIEASLFEESITFLHRMRSNSCIPNVLTYRTLLSGFLRKKQLGWCKRIINMMITEGCHPSMALFNALVHAYCSSGDYAYAYKLLKKMAVCGCKPGYVTYNILIGGICGNEDLPSSDVLELAEKTYEGMLEAGFVLNKVNVGNFAQCLCVRGKFDKAFEVIKEMMTKGFIPDAGTYTKVIGFLCQAYKVEKAFILFEAMKKNGVTPDVYTYTTIIDSFCKYGLLQQARKWFDEMVRDGCAPNVVTYTALIHAYLKARRVPEANELFERMISAGCLPNVVTYSALIDGLCKSGEVEKACHVYSRMRGNVENADVNIYFEAGNTSITDPNVFTYGALIDGLCKAHKVLEARDLLELMSVAGCEPNPVVYDALIDGFCKAGKLDEAQEIFGKMSNRGYSPNVYTYSTFIDRLFKDRRLDLALKVLSRMLENSCAPNVITYSTMIDGLCKVGKTDEAYTLMSMMEEKGCNPNVVTYTAMIDGLGKAGKVEKCLELLRQMSGKGCAPNFVTYSVLINHCCTVGLLDEALALLEEMKQTYWPKYMAGYCRVIQGFNREFLLSHGLLEEIAEYESVPMVHAYRILIDNFSKAGRLEVALALCKEFMSSSACSAFSRNDMYTSLIEGLCIASDVEKAFDLYAEMIGRGDVPELNVFFYLIKGLIRANKWDEALQLSYSICHMDICWQIMEEIYT